jgi:queuosine precursor transporter
MSLALMLLWVIVISLTAAGGAWYARRYGRSDALIALYVTLVVFANIAVGKIVAFDLGVTTVFAPATVLVFAVTFLLTDVVNERFGRAETRRMILLALLSQIALIVFSWMVLNAKGAPFFTNQAAFEALLGSVPRVAFASLVAFFVSENLDAQLFHWFREATGGKHLWMRNAFSSIPAMAVDSIVFLTLAFYGVMPIAPLIIGLITVKWIVGVIDIPFMYLMRAVLGKHSGKPHVEAPQPYSAI